MTAASQGSPPIPFPSGRSSGFGFGRMPREGACPAIAITLVDVLTCHKEAKPPRAYEPLHCSSWKR